MRRFDDEELDARDYIGRSGFGPDFRDIIDRNEVNYEVNSRDERDWEDLKRLPNQTSWVDKPSPNGMYAGMQKVISDPPMSVRTKNQVFNSIGARVGTMTSASQLDRSRGVGEMGDDGGLQSRSEVRPSDLYLGQSAQSVKKGRY